MGIDMGMMAVNVALVLVMQSQTTVLISVASKHYNLGEYGWANPMNPGVSVEKQKATWHMAAGGYYNSSRKLTVYGTVGREKQIAARLSYGYEVGFATGYTRGVVPMGAIFARVGSRSGTHVKINLIPSHRPALAVQVGFRVGGVKGGGGSR